MKKRLLTVTFIASFLLAIIPFVSMAAPVQQLPETTSVGDIIGNITKWTLGIAGAIAVLFLIIGGVRYVISAGNQSQTEAAKKTIIYALVGIVIIALSAVLVNLVLGILSGTAST